MVAELFDGALSIWFNGIFWRLKWWLSDGLMGFDGSDPLTNIAMENHHQTIR